MLVCNSTSLNRAGSVPAPVLEVLKRTLVAASLASSSDAKGLKDAYVMLVYKCVLAFFSSHFDGALTFFF